MDAFYANAVKKIPFNSTCIHKLFYLCENNFSFCSNIIKCVSYEAKTCTSPVSLHIHVHAADVKCFHWSVLLF